MSRIGKMPISVPAGVEVKIDGQVIEVKGPKGTLTHTVPAPITIVFEDGTITVTRPDDERNSRSLHGLTRTLIANNIEGVTKGFTKGGYSHPIMVEPPVGITFQLEGNTKITVSGIDKQAVGEVAANLRKLRKPEPYKGKGVRYAGEVVRRKAGKAGK